MATQLPDLKQPVAEQRPRTALEVFQSQLDANAKQFQMVLPQHIPLDRFKRVVLTAINLDPSLLEADRKSLFVACTRAAQDGLLPDKREGALVIFNNKMKGDDGVERWTKAVQWMPMVYGLIKKMRNSGELASIVAHPVYERDEFDYTLGDDESIRHRPFLDGDPGKMRAVYSIARLKDGTVQREVMTRAEVEKVRAISKSKDKGPWVEWYEEMARKTVVRRLSKYLPMSTEIEDMLRRDDTMAVADQSSRQLAAPSQQITIEHARSAEPAEQAAFDQDTGEVDGPAAITHQEAVVVETSNPAPVHNPPAYQTQAPRGRGRSNGGATMFPEG